MSRVAFSVVIFSFACVAILGCIGCHHCRWTLPHGARHDYGRPDAYEASIDAAIAAFRGEYQQAIERATRAVRHHRRDPVLRTDLARYYLLAGRPDNASRQLRRLLRRHPFFVEGRLVLASCMVSMGDTNGALRQAHIALDHDRGGTQALTWLSTYYQQRNNSRRALFYLRRAIVMNDTDPNLYYQLASLHHELEQLPAARHAFARYRDKGGHLATPWHPQKMRSLIEVWPGFVSAHPYRMVSE